MDSGYKHKAWTHSQTNNQTPEEKNQHINIKVKKKIPATTRIEKLECTHIIYTSKNAIFRTTARRNSDIINVVAVQIENLLKSA